MFGSQALETAVGLALLFFIVATAASAIVEVIARVVRKRSKDLERGIKALLGGEVDDGKTPADVEAVFDRFKETSVWASAEAAAGRTLFRRRLIGPSYLSAKSFADAVTEYLAANPKIDPKTGDPIPGVRWPLMLEKRLAALAQEGQTGILSLKSGIESWFDEAMSRAAGAYKRWTTMILFVIGLAIAVAGNVSAISTAEELWSNPVARTAIADAAAEIEEEEDEEEAAGPDAPAPEVSPDVLDAFADAANQLDKLGFPVGWDDDARSVWTDAFDPSEGASRDLLGPLTALAGWLITAALVMLGAPFWFDLLTRLVALRSTGTKPPTASEDPSSATGALAAAARSDDGSSPHNSDAFARKVGLG